MKKYVAEFLGTTTLVLMGCGSAIFNGGCGSPAQVLMVATAFGLAVIAMVYAIGSISGCHINPAITLGVFLSGRMKGKVAINYGIAQVLGAIFGSGILWLLTQNCNFTGTGANMLQPGVHIAAGVIAELVFTCIFVLVVLASTDEKKGVGNMAGIAIGLTLILIHIVCIPLTGTSVNPARSIGPALFEGGQALTQLWLFVLAPLAGGALAATIWQLLGASKR